MTPRHCLHSVLSMNLDPAKHVFVILCANMEREGRVVFAIPFLEAHVVVALVELAMH